MGKLAVVIVAAGKGTRMGTSESKQYITIGGKPILVHTLLAFEGMPFVDGIVIVAGAGDEARCLAYAEQYGARKLTAVTAGGPDRQSSVYNGLRALGADVEWVLVHDAVRPFVQPAHVDACLARAKQGGAAVLAVPVKDTIKVVDASGRIESTPDRSRLWAIQTPQAFRLSQLRHAHEEAQRAGFVGTDDAMVAERAGIPVHVVEGSYTNIKITTPDDLQRAEWYVSAGKWGEAPQ